MIAIWTSDCVEPDTYNLAAVFPHTDTGRECFESTKENLNASGIDFRSVEWAREFPLSCLRESIVDLNDFDCLNVFKPKE